MPATVLRFTVPTTPAQPAIQIAPAIYPSDMPEVYAMLCDGDCMEPYYMNGQKLCFSRYAPLEAGDPVLIFRRPEYVRPGEPQLLFKQLLASPPATYWQRRAAFSKGNVKPLVIVQMLNPVRQFTFEADSILGIHKCVGTLDEENS